jgi:signal peptidase I
MSQHNHENIVPEKSGGVSGRSLSNTGRNGVETTNVLAAPENEVKSFFKTLVVLLAIFVVIRSTLIEPYKIPSGSMIPTLRIGDHILVNKLSYGIWLPIPAWKLPLPFRDVQVLHYAIPARGEVVVFTKPDDESTLENEADIHIIKRVIGLPGDTVEVKGTSVFINNQEYPETYARWEQNGSPEGYFGPETVPPGHVFLLGDNRDASRDSRFWSYHYLPVERIKGRAFAVYWSWSSWTRIANIIR